MPLHRPISEPRQAILAGLVVCAAHLAGCDGRDNTPPPSATPQNQAQYTYTVRGEIITLPRPGDPHSALMIRHEPIPGFTNREGEVVGMPTMTMEFPPAEGLSLEGFAPGDKVEVLWEVWMVPRMRSQATRIIRLAPETELFFGR